jgi:hypothetical protein
MAYTNNSNSNNPQLPPHPSDLPFHMNLRATGSMPVDGSSRNTIEGSPMVATATDSLRLLPPDKLPAVLCSKSVKSSCTYITTTQQHSEKE